MSYSTKDRYWLERFEEYEQTKLSQRQYCIEHDLVHSEFRYYWDKLKLKPKKEQNHSTGEARFEPIINPLTSPPQPNPTATMIVTLPNKIRCEFKVDTQTDELPKVLAQLVALC